MKNLSRQEIAVPKERVASGKQSNRPDLAKGITTSPLRAGMPTARIAGLADFAAAAPMMSFRFANGPDDPLRLAVAPMTGQRVLPLAA